MGRAAPGVALLLAAAGAAGAPHNSTRGRVQSYHVSVLAAEGHCELTDAGWGQVNRLAASRVLVTERWEWHECDLNGEGHSRRKLLNFYGPSPVAVWGRVRDLCHRALNTTEHDRRARGPPGAAGRSDAEVRLITGGGDSANRIDVVFMGDGYTLAERGRFFEDMQRLNDDMFADTTFRSYLPVFNIWAVHVPSPESGIGTHGKPRDTPFRLYRQGTQLRGVYTGAPQAARDACRLADGCDFPSIIGNDEYYGGLGGEFVIGTRSQTTGTVVLRHEMGHNFVDVGEEYDDGAVYRGVNSDLVNRLANLKWAHWLSEPSQPVARQRAVQRLGEYPWADLAAGRQTFRFHSDGQYARWFLRFTVSGCPESGSLRVLLDGRELPWAPSHPPGAERPDGTTLDRQFYTYEDMQRGFSAGEHTLTFESGFAPPSGAPMRQLCSLSLNEYGDESEFRMDPVGYVSAYPTWDQFGRETLRPTNELCLMRNMTSPHFCPVCKEGMWLQFFARMSVIDDVKVETSAAQTSVRLQVVPLAQFRPAALPGVTERLSVQWTQGGKHRTDLDDQFEFSLPAGEATGSWRAAVRYETSEVRADPDGLLRFTKDFTV
eukprot:TRINITY_DN1422_c2_g1_i1.p1 TRINITY_DN1422_c2_g1~~TRINITY_DN1422_c2_g1_i1.p1  ORF type:complete len:602 (+),score=174.55 TRINITY_DN1422_c2_g1_i1:80-1885(+)